MTPLLVVVWRVTAECPVACDFCGFSRLLERPRLEADPKRVRGFLAALAGHRRASGQEVLLNWLGGEALVWLPLAGLLREAKERHGLRQGVTTSGVTFDRAADLRLLEQTCAEVVVSIDGPEEFHDRVRWLPGLFARVRRGVRALASAKRPPLLRMNTVLMRGNIGLFAGLCDEAAEWGVREVTFNPLGGRERPEFFPDNRLRPEDVRQLREVLPGLRERLAARGVVLRGGEAYLDRLELAARGVARPVEDCGPGREYLFVDERDTVSPCPFSGEGYGVPLAEIGGAEDVGRLPERFVELRRRRQLAVCDDCPSSRVFEKFQV